MNIITGYRAEPHLTSQQDRDVNSSIFGSGIYILNIGSKLAATVISANEIQIADGLIVAEGCAAEVAAGTTESMTISNGDQDMLRKDLIVLRYTKDAGTGVEDMELAVIEGTPAASSPATPSYTSGSITNGDTTVEFPLYTINIDGITIDSVECNVDVVSLAKAATVTALSNKIGSASMGTSATTITAAIKELLTKINTNITNITTNRTNITTNRTNISTLTSKIGSTSMGTTATTVTAAIRELLNKINTHTSNISSAISRISALETKTDGLVRVNTFNVSNGASGYKQLSNVASYMLIVNGASTSDACRGVYLIGVTSGSVLGIKAVSAASGVTVTDSGSGIVKITNSSGLTLRTTLITLYT